MAKYLFALMLAATAVAGCVNVKATAPERIGFGAPPPPSTIAKASPSDLQALRVENQQLRQRVDWLEKQVRDMDRKYKDKQREADKIRAETQQYAAERDRYKKALGQ